MENATYPVYTVPNMDFFIIVDKNEVHDEVSLELEVD